MYKFYGWENAVIKAHGLTPRDYYDILSDIWCEYTCAPRLRGGWSAENKTVGQCSVTAFLMQDIFGGKVYGVPLEDGSVHCFNVVGGCVFDLTSEQFGGRKLDYDNVTEQSREAHFAKTEKRERYEYLKEKLYAALFPGKHDTFYDALLGARPGAVPPEYDWFAPMIGDHECDYYDLLPSGEKRHVKGEWIFRYILEGAGVQDIFIFPSRQTRADVPQPDSEYGTALRIFKKSLGCYDAVYTCAGVMKRLCFTKENGKLVGRVLGEKACWNFSDITDGGFHWENIIEEEDGSQRLLCEIDARKKR